MRCRALLLALVLLPACPLAYATGERDARVAFVPGGALFVEGRNGEVEVRRDLATSDVLVHAEIACSGPTVAAALAAESEVQLVVERGPSYLLSVVFDFPRGTRATCGADVYVRAPELGDVIARSSNGPVKVFDALGDVEVETSNAAVEVSDPGGSTYVSTSNGPVEVSNAHGLVEVETSNGEVHGHLAPDSLGPLRLRSSNAGVTGWVGPAFHGVVTLLTSNAEVYVSDEAGRCTDVELYEESGSLVVGSDGLSSWLRSSNAEVGFHVYATGASH